jgi:putative salt-induced outer membrane protein YdiY
MRIQWIILAIVFGMAAGLANAQGAGTESSALTNSPVFTTGTNTAPASVTNTPPAPITPPASTDTNASVFIKPVKITPSGTLLGALSGQKGGKFSISGRTLRLPAQESTIREDGDWRRHLDFGMNQSKGNTETLRTYIGLDAVKEKDLDLFRIQAKGMYGESSGAKDTENALAAFRYERLLTERFYALGNCEWVTDTIADLRYRGTAVLSPGLRLIRTETTLLNLELGAGYIQEKKASIESGYTAGRAAATIERVLNAHVLVWCTGEYLPKLGDTAVFFLNAEAGLAAYITRDLRLNVSYQERYDSAPVEGKQNSDTVLCTALSLSF